MKKLLIIIIIISNTGLFGQTLQYEGVNPFGIQVTSFDSTDALLRLTMQIDFVDLDGDEDMDILYTGPRLDTVSLGPATDGRPIFLEMQENIGSKTYPIFGDRKRVFDSLEYPTGTTVMFIDAGDLNGDGLIDLVCSAEIDSNDYQSYLLFYFQNPDQSFTKTRCTDFDLDEFIRNSVFLPELTDMDMDGDLDLMVSGSHPDFNDPKLDIPVIMYAKNTGSQTYPEFLGWFYSPYGLDPGSSALIIRTGDLDLDGDLDAFGIDLGSDVTQFKYAQNNAVPNAKPSFDAFELNNLGISPPEGDDVYLIPELCDIDGDGDLDVFIPFFHEFLPSFHFYENVDCEPVQYVIDETICEGESFLLGEMEYTESGTYYNSTNLSSGCIENTILNLEVIPATYTYLDAKICDGETYSFGDEELTEAGEYAQSFQSSTGCDSTVYLTLSVLANQDTYIDELICLGDIFQVGDELFTESGDYEVELVSNEECDSTIYLNLEVIEIDTSIQIFNSVLTAVEDDGLLYQWFDCNTNEDIVGATQNELDVPYSGSFAVEITESSSGCMEVSSCHFVIASSISSIQEPTITVMPNPTTGNIKLINNSGHKVDQLKLYDQSGRIIKTLKGADIRELEIEELKNGLYYFKIYSNEIVYVKEVILLK